MARAFRSLAVAAALAADDKKGSDITLLHPGRKHPLADYLLIITASSRPHLESLEKAILAALESKKISRCRRGRPQSDSWRVLDFGGLLVHLMTSSCRDFYSLEKLYSESPRVLWRKNSHARSH